SGAMVKQKRCFRVGVIISAFCTFVVLFMWEYFDVDNFENISVFSHVGSSNLHIDSNQRASYMLNADLKNQLNSDEAISHYLVVKKSGKTYMTAQDTLEIEYFSENAAAEEESGNEYSEKMTENEVIANLSAENNSPHNTVPEITQDIRDIPTVKNDSSKYMPSEEAINAISGNITIPDLKADSNESIYYKMDNNEIVDYDTYFRNERSSDNNSSANKTQEITEHSKLNDGVSCDELCKHRTQSLESCKKSLHCPCNPKDTNPRVRKGCYNLSPFRLFTSFNNVFKKCNCIILFKKIYARSSIIII
ncbi:hypothetical protein L9F63_022384, partial [Diploptera punctata]